MTNVKTLMENLPLLLKDRGLLIISVVCVALGIIITLLSGKIVLDYTAAEETKSKITMIEEYLQKYEDKKQKVEGEKYRPIDLKELENVQAEILLAVQGNNLKMEGLRSIKDDDKIESSGAKNDAAEVVDGKKENRRKNVSKNKAYELTVSGSYEDTMKFLFNFNVKRALITMRALSITPENESYKTKLNYKIYIK